MPRLQNIQTTDLSNPATPEETSPSNSGHHHLADIKGDKSKRHGDKKKKKLSRKERKKLEAELKKKLEAKLLTPKKVERTKQLKVKRKDFRIITCIEKWTPEGLPILPEVKSAFSDEAVAMLPAFVPPAAELNQVTHRPGVLEEYSDIPIKLTDEVSVYIKYHQSNHTWTTNHSNYYTSLRRLIYV